MSGQFRVGVYPEWTDQVQEYIMEAIKQVLLPLPNLVFSIMKDTGGVATPEVLDEYDAVIILTYQFTPESFKGVKRISCISRWGVGYDKIDIPSATEAGVCVAITPPAVRRSVAEAIIAWCFSLSMNVSQLDKRVREGRWRYNFRSTSFTLEGRVLGTIGVGNIGRELCKIARGVGFIKILAYDPYVTQQQVDAFGVTLVDFETVFKESDFVTVNVPLNDKTFHLIGEKEFSLMKPTAYFINTSRGPVVDEAALIKTLKEGKIAGAGIDVFEQEPPAKDNPLFFLDNVILAPHAIAWTHELMAEISRVACLNIKSVYEGKSPKYLANPAVRNNNLFLAKIVKRRQGSLPRPYTPPTLPCVKVNNIQKARSEGRVPVGHMVWEFSTRGIARLVQNSGVDFVLVDMEHSGFSMDTVNNLLSYLRGTSVTTIVRVPIATDYTYIARIMDAGAQGIMAPNVKNPEEARKVLNAMKYAPKGCRGIGFGMAHTDYKGISDCQKFMDEINQHTTFICQIESQEAVDKIEQIAAIDGVDILWVGQNDLSNDMGIVGQTKHPLFLEALNNVVTAGKKYNKGLGMQPCSVEDLKEWLGLGFDVISWNVDSSIYQNALKEGVTTVRYLSSL